MFVLILCIQQIGADVEKVMIDGKVVMQNRKMTNLDEKEVMRKVKKIAKRLCK